MNKNLITLALALSLTACGGSSTPTPEPEPQPTNTPASFAGTSTAQIDVTSSTITHTATVTDVDTGEAAFTPQTATATSYGTFSINANGEWTYEIDSANSDIVALTSGEMLTDTITVTSADGTQGSITVTIEKSGNAEAPATPAVITGTNSANIYHIGTSVTGALSITDVNEGEAEFTSNTDAKYGSFSISKAGLWTYDIDKANSDVSMLASGETLTDTIKVTSVDGTQATVTITIEYGDSGTLITPSLPSGVLTIPTIACDQEFTDIGELEDAATTDMAAGTTLCIGDGTYTDGLVIKFGGAGTEEAPIKVAAKNPGKVIFKGEKVSIKMGGSYTQLQGLIFEDNVFSSSFVETRLGSNLEDLCLNCRVTENTFINGKATSSGAIYAHIFGKGVWVDHNIFSGKTAANPMISLNRWVSDDATDAEALQFIAQGIVVYGNYIANRPPANGKMYANSGDNDYEAVRTGLSATHHYPGNSIVAGNLFENIQGEAEVISNKGSNNVISGNTVRNSYGSITNRHGNTNVISNNFMFGDGYPYAGGLRIVDDGHTITNNYIEGARYKDTSHHGGIVIIGHDGAGDGDNGYQQVENVHIAHNTVVNSVNSINIDGGGKSTQPKKVYFANNLVDQAVGDVFVDTARGVSSDSFYAGNIVHGSGDLAETTDVSESTLGATFTSAMLVKGDDGLYRPTDSSPSLAAVTGYEKAEFDDVTKDMDGTSRGDSTEAGADDINTDTVASAPLTYGSVGPQSYDYEKPAAIMVEADIVNADFEDGLTAWTGGTLINTTTGSFAGNGILLSDSATAVQADIALTADSKYAVSAFVKDTYSLVVNDHVFEGKITSDDYKYVVHEFTTGATETMGTITLKVADEVVLDAGVVDADMDDFEDNNSLNVWIKHQDSDAGLGYVGTSSDRAFSGGSARIKFKYTEDDDDTPDVDESVTEAIDHDLTATPGVSQIINDAPTGVDLTYSLYYCDKKGDDDELSLTSLHYGVKDGSGTIIADAHAHVSDLDDAPAGTTKDCFKQVTLLVPNNTESTVEIFAFMEVDTSTMTDAEIYATEQFIEDDLEVRVGEFSLTYKQTVEAGSEALFDEVRLIKRTIDELAD